MIERNGGIESLLDRVIDGACDEAELRRFEATLRADPRVLAAYVEQMRLHALLEWHHGRVGSGPCPIGAPPGRGGRPDRRRRIWGGFPIRIRGRGLAAVLLIGVVLAIVATRAYFPGVGVLGGAVATLIEARDVSWAGGQPPIAVGARLGPREIHCLSGTLRLAFDFGALVTVEGPADLRVLSGNQLRATRGRITGRFEGGAAGFAVETPSALVVDRGTEFGVEVDASGQTGVVVFDGLVDLSRRGAADGPTPIKQLGRGEAMRVDPSGLLSRIIAVERRPGAGAGWSTEPTSDRDDVIRSVRDNIRGLESRKYYEIVHRGLVDDAPAYVDRLHQWNGLDPAGLPGFLRGADYIMPFNDDKWMSDLQVTVEVARPATLYLFYDDREQLPPWLTEEFTDTGVNVGLDECSSPRGTPLAAARGPGLSIDHVFSVWARDLERGESIRLGALGRGANAKAMYGIAAVARP